MRRNSIPFRWRAGGARLRAALVWILAFAMLSGGYGLLAPVMDDRVSAMRAMRTDCRVVRAIDGDTVDLACPEQGAMRVRILGYDAPELFSPKCDAEHAAALRATQTLRNLARLAPVEVAFRGHDRYGRWLADMRLGGRRVATAMVESGNGRRYFGSLREGWC